MSASYHLLRFVEVYLLQTHCTLHLQINTWPCSSPPDRVIPVIRALRESKGAASGAVLSVDTFDADVAREAILAGADMVNDVSGGTMDARMHSQVGIMVHTAHASTSMWLWHYNVCMHAQTGGSGGTMEAPMPASGNCGDTRMQRDLIHEERGSYTLSMDSGVRALQL